MSLIAAPPASNILIRLAMQNKDQNPALSELPFLQALLYVGKAPIKCANKPIPRLTSGILKNTQITPLINNSAKQIYSNLPRLYTPFQKLSRQIKALPTRNIRASNFEELLLLLARTAA